MLFQLKTAEEAGCCFRDSSKADSDHASQLHIPLPSLPSPDTPINIPSFPIDVRSETSVFKPRNIANLWAQLLSIQIQNGNFWKYENAVALHKEKTPPPVLSRDEVKQAEMMRLEKGVLYLRHKIQKGFLIKDQQPIEAELPELSRFISKLESFGDIDASIIRATKIHKVCKGIKKLVYVTGDDIYQFKSRSAALLDRYTKILDQQENTATVKTSHSGADSQTEVEEETLKEAPAICLTQLTPEQCVRIEEAAKACNPPLHRGVVELMCMLPYLTSKYGTCDLQVVPSGRLDQPFDDFPELDRGVYRGGPTIPPNMLKLTYWTSPGYGVALFVDTETGEGLQLDQYNPDGTGVICTKFEGLRRPIEELLQEWIDNFLKMKLVPTGGEDIMSDGFRSMDYLKLKSILQDSGWPSAFPLSQSDYTSLIKQQTDVQRDRFARWEKNNSFNQIWNKLTRLWHQRNKTNFNDSTKMQEGEIFKALDGSIERALKYHLRKIEDRKYALAADEPLDEKYRGPLVLSSSAHIGSDWRLDITPAMIVKRFDEVVGPSPWEDAEVEKMRTVLEEAYERWEMREKGVHPRDYVDEEDDDETSDYVPSEEECSEEEEYETAEEDEDLDFDVVMLEEDITTDIEDLRKRMESYGVGA